MKTLIFAEFQNGQIKKGTLELLTAAKEGGCEIKVLAVGPGASDAVATLQGWGASTAFCCDDEKLKDYNPELFTAVIAELVEKEKPELLLASSSMLARDLFPRVAARTNSGCVSDCTELNISDSKLNVRRPLYSGKCTATVNFKNCETRMVLMRANQLPVAEVSGDAPAIEKLDLPATDLKTTVKEVVKGESQKLDLTEANFIGE